MTSKVEGAEISVHLTSLNQIGQLAAPARGLETFAMGFFCFCVRAHGRSHSLKVNMTLFFHFTICISDDSAWSACGSERVGQTYAAGLNPSQ